MQDALRFWIERGVGGLPRGRDRPAAEGPGAARRPAGDGEPFGLPLREEETKLALTHSRNAPDTGAALAQIREAVGDAPARGRGLPAEREVAALPRAPRRGVRVRAAARAAGTRSGCARRSRRATRRPGAAWVLSNHDFGRLVTRFGAGERARGRAAAAHAARARRSCTRATRSGSATARAASACYDRAGRDRFRHPMQWDASPSGGFTHRRARGCRAVDPERTNVEAQRDDPRSTLSLVRDLLDAAARAGRRASSCSTRRRACSPTARGDHAVAINTTAEERPAPLGGEVVLETAAGRAARRRRSRRTPGRSRWDCRAPTQKG